MSKAMSGYQYKEKIVGKVLLALAVLGAAGCVYVFLKDKPQFAFSYLTSFVFFICLALGGLFFVMIHHLTRAGWSVVVRRLAENIAFNLQWIWILAIPLLAFCMGDLFHWTHEEAAKDPVLAAKSAYLNQGFFIIRAALYFAVWVVISRFLLTQSVKQDKTAGKNLTLSLQKWSAPAMILYVITETFFAFDWIMSLAPHWFSTIFGVYFFTCSAVGIMALLIIISCALRIRGYLKEEINVEHYHDLGKLLFGWNMFWAYIAFSQFLLIWYANLGEETPFFHARAEGSWKTLSVMLPIIHFAIPFFFMISRNVKRNITALTISAVWLFVVNYIDIYWLIMPAHNHHGIHYGLADVSSLLFIGSLFFYFLVKKMEDSALVPQKDPRLEESLKFTNM